MKPYDFQSLKPETIRSIIEHWVTQYDISAQGKRGYNPNALAIMLYSIDDNVMPMLAKGKSMREALRNGFQDRCLAFLEKNILGD